MLPPPAGLVLDDELLAEIFRQPVRQGACNDFGTAARRKRHDQANDLARIGLRVRSERNTQGGRKRAKNTKHDRLLLFAAKTGSAANGIRTGIARATPGIV